MSSPSLGKLRKRDGPRELPGKRETEDKRGDEWKEDRNTAKRDERDGEITGEEVAETRERKKEQKRGKRENEEDVYSDFPV